MIQIEPNEKVLMEVEKVIGSDKIIHLKRFGDLVLTNKRLVWEGSLLDSKKGIEVAVKDIVKVEKLGSGLKSVGIAIHTKDSKYYFTQRGTEGHIITRMLKKHYSGKEPSLIELSEKIKELI